MASFRGDRFFLSNFYKCNVRYSGVLYPTSEHAYQAQKPNSKEGHDAVRNCLTPGQAKREARRWPHWPDFHVVKVSVMRDIVRAKFTQNLGLKQMLLDTGDEPLVEENTWGDRFWGTVNGQGENWLGRILMEVRGDLKSQSGG
jgi:ribA/ribD-fused uncharacterized protein